MSGFVSDPSPTTIPWRDPQLGRELPPAIPHQDSHHPHHLQQHHQQSYHPHSHTHHTQGNYERYSPSVNSEPSDYREWQAPTGQESHSPGQSPHSHNSGSLTGSPGLHPSSHNSSGRRDSDMSVGVPVAPEHRLAIERRQEKRKNKRHRLTHNETRFLMSEFARQAHPDAAHRERLAREIPGLTPRQVQVWFQNRRAKLKRMSSDDRERMMKSRALPEEFPILQTLHTYGSRMMGGTPLASPSDYSPTPNLGYRPDPLGRRRPIEDDVNNMSPTNNAFAGLSFSASSSNGELLSPISVSGERGYLPPYVTSPLGPQNRNPFSRPTDFRHPNVPRLQLHDVPRSVSEPQSAPVRSTSYSNSPLENGEYQLTGYSIQTYVEPPRSVPPEGSHSPFGQAPGQQNTYTQPYASPSTTSTPLRPPPFSSSVGMNPTVERPTGCN